jgi:hypothetical protein
MEWNITVILKNAKRFHVPIQVHGSIQTQINAKHVLKTIFTTQQTKIVKDNHKIRQL